MPKTLIIGPSKSGKTHLVASLSQAAFGSESKSFVTNVYPRSDSAMRLFKSATRLFLDGTMADIASNTDIREYEFEVEVKKRTFKALSFFINEKFSSEQFVMIDGPGGAIFGYQDEASLSIEPSLMDDFHKLLIKTAKECDGLIICADPVLDRELSSGKNFSFDYLCKNLPEFLYEAEAKRHGQLKRIAICLTKADKYFYSKRDRARTAASDPDVLMSALIKTIQKADLERLDANVPDDATIAYGWTSAYGFLGDGSPNLHMDGEETIAGLKDSASDRAANWQPFQVLDPFHFMMTGKLGGFHIWKSRRK